VLAVESQGGQYTIAPDVMQLFRRHNWPGNFRQLTNLLRTAMIMAGGTQNSQHEIRREHLPDDFLEDIDLASAASPHHAATRLHDAELSLIRKTLAEHGGNVSAAAKVLGISRNTIYRRLGR
jgi:transcriptional regulator with PAS, ATPase and Fis domain